MVKVGERIVVIPRWAWAVMATFGGTVVAVSVSFMAWLALTTVDHGTKLARIEAHGHSVKFDHDSIRATLRELKAELDTLCGNTVSNRLFYGMNLNGRSCS